MASKNLIKKLGLDLLISSVVFTSSFIAGSKVLDLPSIYDYTYNSTDYIHFKSLHNKFTKNISFEDIYENKLLSDYQQYLKLKETTSFEKYVRAERTYPYLFLSSYLLSVLTLFSKELISKRPCPRMN